MKNEMNRSGQPDKTMAAVCGLYCGACSLYIGTTEEPARLEALAAKFGLPAEAARCYGCRSDRRFPPCDSCRMSACAAERGIDFCSQCSDYPCDHLKAFQAERPHRIELWNDLDRIRAVGYEKWLGEVREEYRCPGCRTINSAYDLKCRTCGNEPSSPYVERHREEILRFLAGRELTEEIKL